MIRELGKARIAANLAAACLILALAGWGVTFIAARHWHVQPTFTARAEFPTIDGITVGDPVRVQGIDAGVVKSIEPPAKPSLPVRLTLRIDKRLHSLVRVDAVARINAQGLVGGKVVEIVPGAADSAELPDGGVIRSEPPVEISGLLKSATKTLEQIDEVAKAARVGLGEVNAIAAGIRQGKGSLGRLVQDDRAYDRLIDLSRQGEKTLVNLEENLSAMKRTWPLSRYFNDRAFFDRDRVLFHPGAVRDEMVIGESELFEPNRSVLTAGGRRKLDEAAAWFQKCAQTHVRGGHRGVYR